MPESFLCYRPDPNSPEVGKVPQLTAGHITFCSFNVFTKVNPSVITTWSTILNQIPNSRLLMKTKVFTDRDTREYTLNLFLKQGVSAERIELLPEIPSYREHIALYKKVDIALDTFPYNGTTTTCEALWMGVPVIVLEGTTHVSRVGVSLLSNVGLNKCIARTPDEFVELAVQLAHNFDKLKFFRNNLRNMMLRSPLTDKKNFTINLEKAYREMWKKWCNSP
jgi:predicted O-linked N-acetylglucosamine transferase (SPINDLY family)